MTTCRRVAAFLSALILLSVAASAQDATTSSTSVDFQQHKFFDRQNSLLFGTHVGLAATDFALTHRNLASGGTELNPIARPFTDLGTPGEVLFFAGSTAVSIGTSYLLHRTHHHSLERWVARYGVAESGAAVAFDLAQGSAASTSAANRQIGFRVQLLRR
jgi:hypothetical protein